MGVTKLCAAIILQLCWLRDVTGVLVNTSCGPVVGKQVPVADFGPVSVFYGIPYARPPLGKLRFAFPEPADCWSTPLNATTPPNTCYQTVDTMYMYGFPQEGVTMWNPNTKVSEDCLYLNVWSPATGGNQGNSTALLPVMVWIYGGGFTTGSSTLEVYDGKVLAASQKVVVASMQYRLNAFGFLFLNSSSVPGNAGLADQQLALRWIQANAKAFGGDPERITIFGESAGAASVNYQLLINHGRFPTLIRAAVLQSATALSTWAYLTPSDLLLRSRILASCVGCPDELNTTNTSCLQSADSDKLLTCQSKISSMNSNLMQLNFVPTIDYHGLLADNPAQLVATGRVLKVPLIIGVCLNEGTYFALYLNSSLVNYSCSVEQTTYGTYLNNVQQFLYPASASAQDVNQAFLAATAEKLALDYLSFVKVEDNGTNCLIDRYLSAYEQLIGDGAFKCANQQLARLSAEAGLPVYFYNFRHRTRSNPWPLWTGVLHGDEIEYIFGLPLVKTKKYTDEEQALSRLMLNAWANFAKTGNASVAGQLDWPMFTKYSSIYVNLDAAGVTGNKITVGEKLRESPCQLLSKFPQFNQFAQFGVSISSSSSVASPANRNWLILFHLSALFIALR